MASYVISDRFWLSEATHNTPGCPQCFLKRPESIRDHLRDLRDAQTQNICSGRKMYIWLDPGLTVLKNDYIYIYEGGYFNQCDPGSDLRGPFFASSCTISCTISCTFFYVRCTIGNLVHNLMYNLFCTCRFLTSPYV